MAMAITPAGDPSSYWRQPPGCCCGPMRAPPPLTMTLQHRRW